MPKACPYSSIILDFATPSLSWTHYKHLIRVSDDNAREYYAEEAVKGGWSVRELEHQIEL